MFHFIANMKIKSSKRYAQIYLKSKLNIYKQTQAHDDDDYIKFHSITRFIFFPDFFSSVKKSLHKNFVLL